MTQQAQNCIESGVEDHVFPTLQKRRDFRTYMHKKHELRGRTYNYQDETFDIGQSRESRYISRLRESPAGADTNHRQLPRVPYRRVEHGSREDVTYELAYLIFDSSERVQRAAQYGRGRGHGHHIFSHARAFWFYAPLIVKLLVLAWLATRTTFGENFITGFYTPICEFNRLGARQPDAHQMPFGWTVGLTRTAFAMVTLALCSGLILFRASLWTLDEILNWFCDMDLDKFYFAWAGVEEIGRRDT